MTQAIKPASKRRRKADEDDIERMQDDKIDALKEQMIKAATLDVDKNSQGQIATEKLKLLSKVTDVLARADLAISILDNNLLEAVRLWLEPLPDASMPAYQIQKINQCFRNITYKNRPLGRFRNRESFGFINVLKELKLC